MSNWSKIPLALLLLLPVTILHAESLRVSPQWLKQHLGDKDLVIIDARTANDYDIEHIQGALNLSHELTYQQKRSSGNIVEPDVMQKLLRQRGINDDNRIIVYDSGEMFDASRVFWAMEVYGLKHVKVLNSGYAQWTRLGYPVSADVPKVEPSQYVAQIDHRRIASKFITQLATANPNQQVVDARSLKAYEGKESTAKRFGHIPTAISIPVSLNLKKVNGVPSLRSEKVLSKVYAKIPKNEKVILYCEIGRVSSTNYLILRELGYDVANYDASWREWGNDLNLPIEK